MNTKLKYIKSKLIDKPKWDTLISASPNGHVFSFSWYLDSFCEWDIIILDDYLGGMAIPNRKRLGIKQMYQPNFVQLCSWVGQELSAPQLKHLIAMLQKHFSLIHLNTNLPISHAKERTNLVICLDKPLDEIRNAYSRSLKRNLKKASNRLLINETSSASEVIALYKGVWGEKNPQLKDADYTAMLSLIKTKPTYFVCMSVAKNDKCLAGIILIKGKDRLHYIIGANSMEGKKENALSYLLDYVITKNVPSKTVFDFEGSSIPSVRHYYSSFGAINEPFYEVELHSKPIALLKKVIKG